ncbi:MAG TPA: hypothetical protein PKZ70_06750 [Candidatus Atribacteria bacterium]|nr:hypothetical protein [Candidatus Atribacteria bacterium]
MWAAIIIFLVFVAVSTLLFRYTTILAGRMVGKKIEKTHRAAEHIISTKMPPEDWLEKWKKKIESIKKKSNDAEKINELKLKARDDSLKKLSSLVKYFENSDLVADEETRKIILEELAEADRLWKENWSEVEL